VAVSGEGHIIEVGFPNDPRTLVEQARHQRGVNIGYVPFHHLRTTGHLDTRDRDVVLDRDIPPRYPTVVRAGDLTPGNPGVVWIIAPGAPAWIPLSWRGLGGLRLAKIAHHLIGREDIRDQLSIIRDLVIGQIKVQVIT
jgi:hypothetical protein